LDRAPWLERIRDAAYSLEQKNESGVIVCSALKRSYRDQIRAGNNGVIFLFLDGDYDLILSRMKKRQDHFMRESMLQSQFEALERPDNETGVLYVKINEDLDQVIADAHQSLESML
jgi:gluconokinase